MLPRARRKEHGEETKLDAEEGDPGEEIEVGRQEGNEDEGESHGSEGCGWEEGAGSRGSSGPGRCGACCHYGLRAGIPRR
jgi:hypothetical protein